MKRFYDKQLKDKYAHHSFEKEKSDTDFTNMISRMKEFDRDQDMRKRIVNQKLSENLDCHALQIRDKRT